MQGKGIPVPSFSSVLDPLPARTQMHQTCLVNRSHCILHTVSP